MTLPLRRMSSEAANIELRQMDPEQLEYFRYGLRRRYALDLMNDGFGAVIMGAGDDTNTAVGSAVNTVSFARTSAAHPHSHPAAPGIGTTTDEATRWQMNFTGMIEEVPDFNNSYAVVTSDLNVMPLDEITIGPQTNSDIVQALIIDPCIAEMRTGDEVGTYKVSVTTPGAGWIDADDFFTDSIFGSSTLTKLWLKTSSNTLPATEYTAVRGTTTGFQFINNNAMDEVGNLMYILLQQRVTAQLRYVITPDEGSNPRGSFMDTRFTTGTSSPSGGGSPGADDYRTISTPSGGLMTFNTYNFGLTP